MAATDAEDRVARRTDERRAAAAIRAVSGRAGAEWRTQRLTLEGRPVPIATPHLLPTGRPPATPDEVRRSRGIADGLALRLRFSDRAIHERHRPDATVARVLFDALEQLRCEALAPVALVGLRANLDGAFEAWTREAVGDRVAESRTAMLVFTTVQMVRSRLLRVPLDPDVDEITEATRFHLAPVVGHALRELAPAVDDQDRYAVAAGEIARLVTEMTEDGGLADTSAIDTRHRLVVPAEWDHDDADPDRPSARTTGTVERFVAHDRAAMTTDLDELGDYRVFTSEYDRVVTGDELYVTRRLRTARAELDGLIAAQAVSAPRLAVAFRRLFGQPTDDDWSFGHDDGVLDGRRLSRLATTRSSHEAFKRRRPRLTGDTAVSFLIDNSGSMKRQRFESVAVLVDTFSRALDLAGVTNEVLGFTTGGWAGGRPIADWRRAGEPPEPGRMNELLHIVYKDAGASWRRSRLSLAAMLRTDHYREGLDGEALAWAHDRLMRRPEPRRMLVLISDGSPTDAATANVNRPGFLDDHLVAMADRIERLHAITGRGVQLGAIGIDLDMDGYVRRSVNADLSETLTLRHYGALATLMTG